MKRLSLWTLPEVLVVHLKRFRQVSCCDSSFIALLVRMSEQKVPAKVQCLSIRSDILFCEWKINDIVVSVLDSGLSHLDSLRP